MNDQQLGFVCHLYEEMLEQDCEIQLDEQFYSTLHEYEEKLEEKLEEFCAKWPLAGKYTVTDLMYDGASYNVFMTLQGHGIGIWDGRWDHYWDSNRVIEVLEIFLKENLLPYVTEYEDGKLEQEFWRCMEEKNNG